LIADVLVIGSGPAGLAIAAELCEQGNQVTGLSLSHPRSPWKNTYGIWCDDLEALGLGETLGFRWKECSVYAQGQEINLGRDYGLFDNRRLQNHLLDKCDRAGMGWLTGSASRIDQDKYAPCTHTKDGQEIRSRVVIDASGHTPALIKRPGFERTAYQAAYGIIGRFSKPPVRPGQMVLMDYRMDSLAYDEQASPPTFLYSMDFGDGVYFVEETSLANHPAVDFKILEARLIQRLNHMGIQVVEIQHVEHCLFPMNLPLPYFNQPVVGFGGAASMVHPASGYLVGAVLKRAPGLASAIAQALASGNPPSSEIAQLAWETLWPAERIRKRNLYLFGLENIMLLDGQMINRFFKAFFDLPYSLWSGYLSDHLSYSQLLQTMSRLFLNAPWDVRRSLISSIGSQGRLVKQAIFGEKTIWDEK
jgi:lycopene cyclase-like protein